MVDNSPRLWDHFSVVLLLICIWLPAALLTSTGWAAGLDLVELLALVGASLGLFLGRSKLNSAFSNLIFVILSVLIPLWLFVIRMTPDGGWSVRLGSLGQRTQVAFSQAISGQAVQDPLVFVMFCAYFFWTIGYVTGFGFTRRWNPWQGLLAAAGIFGVIDFYAKTSVLTSWLGASLIFLLFLLASRLFWLNRKFILEGDGYKVEREAGESISQLAAVLGILLVFLAWNLETIIRSFTPGTSEYERVSELWQNIQMSLQNNFVSLQGTTTLTGTYPGGMELGSQTPEDPSPAFLVELISEPSEAAKYYWRVKSFYEYRDGHWQAPIAVDNNEAALKTEEYSGSPFLSTLSTRYFWQSADGSVIPYSGRFSSLDIPFRLTTSEKPVGQSGDVQVFPVDLIKEGDVFHLNSAMFTGSQLTLREINSSIPSDISASSLQLPETVPARVRELAKEIAIGNTVAERVMSVTRFLRTQYKYKNQIPSPPRGKDPVDWFLFEKKEGFCTYFATAEVILLRAAGIPARMAVGYSQGERMENTYLVRLNDAHAWPEVYFPDIGWLPFEPTVNEGEPPYSNPPESDQDENDDLTPEERRGNINEVPQNEIVPNIPEPETEQVFQNSWMLFIALALLVCVVFWMLWLKLKKRLRLKPFRLPKILVQLLRFLRIPVPRWLHWWDWYTSLTPLALRYYWIEKTSIWSGIVSRRPVTPADLLTVLAAEFPTSKPDILLFWNGLYSEIYSRDIHYPVQKCIAAGKGVQQCVIRNAFARLWRGKIS